MKLWPKRKGVGPQQEAGSIIQVIQPISGDDILPASIITQTLKDGSIATAKIKDLAVTTAKINSLAVTTAKIDSLAVGTAQIAALAVTSAKINDLAVDKLTAGSITSKAITLAIAVGTGDSKIQAGKTDFTNTESGFILGLDDSDLDKAKFYIGDSSTYLNWTGSALTIKGAVTITAGSGIANLTDAGALATKNTIGNAYIDDLAVSKLTTGTLAATIIIANTFKTAVSPNPRIEITSSYIAGYSDATTKQFYLQASDGKAYFGAGTCVADSTGLTVAGEKIKLQDSAATYTNSIYTDTSGNFNINCDPTGTSRVILLAERLYAYRIMSYDIRPRASGTYSVGGTSTGDNGYFEDMVTRTLTLSETTTPTAVADFGKIYTKNDNKLYFQDGAGTEHTVAFV